MDFIGRVFYYPFRSSDVSCANGTARNSTTGDSPARGSHFNATSDMCDAVSGATATGSPSWFRGPSPSIDAAARAPLVPTGPLAFYASWWTSASFPWILLILLFNLWRALTSCTVAFKESLKAKGNESRVTHEILRVTREILETKADASMVASTSLKAKVDTAKVNVSVEALKMSLKAKADESMVTSGMEALRMSLETKADASMVVSSIEALQASLGAKANQSTVADMSVSLEGIRANTMEATARTETLQASLGAKVDSSVVTELQKLVTSLYGEVASLRGDLTRTQKMLDEARTGAFEAVTETTLALNQDTTTVQTLALTGVPSDASAVLVSFYSRSRNEGPSRDYCVSVWSVVGERRHIHRHRVFRCTQNAISFDNEAVWFPLAPGQTELVAQLDSAPPAGNRLGTILRICGFRTGRSFLG